MDKRDRKPRSFVVVERAAQGFINFWIDGVTFTTKAETLTVRLTLQPSTRG